MDKIKAFILAATICQILDIDKFIEDNQYIEFPVDSLAEILEKYEKLLKENQLPK